MMYGDTPHAFAMISRYPIHHSVYDGVYNQEKSIMLCSAFSFY